MATTPLWVPLVVAALAVLGTLAGVVFTQVWNSRLDDRRWARESARLHEAQAREDTNRTYEHRRAAYIDFLRELERLERQYIAWNREPIAPPGPFDARVYNGLYERFSAVVVYGTREAELLALISLTHLQQAAAHPEHPLLVEQAVGAREDYVKQVRKDLGVPEGAPEEEPGDVASGQRTDRGNQHADPS
jgi:hypothetical protein